MEQTPNTPPQTTPVAPPPAPAAVAPTPAPVPVAPAAAPMPAAQPSQTHWGLIAAAVVVLLLAGAGVYAYMMYGPQLMDMMQPTPTTEQTPTATETQQDDLNGIEADLNAGGEASTSGDVDQLGQSL